MATIETRKRSFIKTITYRIATIIADLIIIYALTRRVDVTIGLTALTNIASSFLYYSHERAWSLVAWGRKKKS